MKRLIDKNYKNIWFFLQFNFELSFGIIKKYYDNRTISLNNSKILDKRFQVLMFIWKENENKYKKKNFKIKIKSEILEFYSSLVNENNIEPHKVLNARRLYKIPESIGCFNLERFNYSQDEIVNMYLNDWEYYANNCPYWKEIFENWGVEFKKSETLFINDDVLEKFYLKYGLEPDEQSLETHNKSIDKIEKYDINIWIKNFSK